MPSLIMSNFYAYIRVSTTKQGTHGVSLQEQRSAIERYAKNHNLTISSWFEETLTAAKHGRPAFAQMLSLLKKGKAEGIIVHKIDRSARNLRDWADLGELIDRGLTVHFVNENLDLHSRGGRLSADIQAIVAADYIRNLREETRKGFYGRLKQGLYPLPAPVGYRDCGKGKPKEPDPVTAPLIREAFELYSTGTYTLKTLTPEMHRRGLRNKKGGAVSLSGISRILNNPFYKGVIYLTSTGETFPGIHSPLVSTALFKHVQDELRGKHHKKALKHHFQFRKQFACKLCGYRLTGELQKGRVYYRCHTKNCPTISAREDYLESAVQDALRSIRLPDGILFELQKLNNERKKTESDEKQTHIHTLELQQKNLEERYRRLTDAYLEQFEVNQTVIEKGAFLARKKQLINTMTELKERLSTLRSTQGSLPERVEKFFELTKTAYSSHVRGLPHEKANLLKSVTSNRWVEGKKVEIELQSPFLEVANWVKMTNSAPHRDTSCKRKKKYSPSVQNSALSVEKEREDFKRKDTPLLDVSQEDINNLFETIYSYCMTHPDIEQ